MLADMTWYFCNDYATFARFPSVHDEINIFLVVCTISWRPDEYNCLLCVAHLVIWPNSLTIRIHSSDESWRIFERPKSMNIIIEKETSRGHVS